MNILMTNHQMERRGGSELFVDEVARKLLGDGHRVCVFSTLLGPLSSQLEDAGVPVVSDPSECPFRPDIIHGQHHLETMTALCCWLDVPAIYYVHGSGPWEEHPPVHPRIRKYLGTAPRLAWWIAHECGVEEASVGVVRNFFDPSRFREVRSPDARSGRALVFHNQLTESSAAYHALRDACRQADLTCETLGFSFGRTVEEPGKVLTDYDVVFAAGRSAIEAMACGCAVIPIPWELLPSVSVPRILTE